MPTPSGYSDEALQKIHNEVEPVIRESLGLKEQARVYENSRFTDDLGADSLDMTELVMGLEDRYRQFDMAIPDEDLEKMETVGDAVRYISRFLEGRRK